MIRDSLDYWVTEYHIDGFRLDLAGSFSMKDFSDWGEYLNRQHPDAKLVIYGEPWAADNDVSEKLIDNPVRTGRMHMQSEGAHMKTDVVIIGAGPAGIFTALEMIKKNSRKKIIMVEKGKAIENRHCPKATTGKCMNCKPYCHITTGFSGAGAFSDGKLSLSYEVGGDLPTLIGEEKAQETIDEEEAKTVRLIFEKHMAMESIQTTVAEINRLSPRTREWVSVSVGKKTYCETMKHFLRPGIIRWQV